MTKKTFSLSEESHDNPAYKDNSVVPVTSFNGVEKAEKKSKEPEKPGSDNEEKPENLVGLGALFRFATKTDIILMIAGTVFAMSHGACLPLLLLVFGDMTDIFIDAAGNVESLNQTEVLAYGCNWTEHGYSWDDINPPDGDYDKLNKVLKGCYPDFDVQTLLLDEMEKYAIYYIWIASVVVFAAYGQVAFWLMAAYRQTQRIRTTLFRAIMRQEIGWFDTHDAGELNNRISDDVEKIEKGIGDKLGNFFQWFSTFITGMVIGFTYGWKLSLVIMSVSPLLVLCGALFTMLSGLATAGELSAYAKAGAVAQEVLSSIRTVFAFGGQEKEAGRYKVRLAGAQKYGIKKALYNGTSYGAVYLIIYGVFALAFWYGAKLVRDEPNNYTGGKVLIVFFAVLMGAFALGNAGPNLQHMSTARGAASYIWELVDRVPEIDSFSEEGIKPDDLVGNVSIRDAKFFYPSRPEVQVLNGLTLDVSKGQIAALVGHSGCGKSTVVQLLQRFYDLESGTVMIDGKDVKTYNIKWLRQHIGVVSQEPVLFDTTIKENIMFGRENVSMDEIIEATKQSNAYDFIQKLPKKYDTLVGERGTQLSGGQKQRIAIARALVRNPKILLLDEATSALDTESEATVQSALDKASQGRTTLVIAHRLSTIRNADVIFGIKDGRVQEQGSHSELMALGEGIYHKLVTSQKTMDPAHIGTEEDDDIVSDKDIFAANEKKSPVKRQRTVSVNEKKDDKEEEEDLPEMSIVRVMRMNAPEWLFIVIGCIAAIANGGNQPAMAVLFAEIIGLFAKPEDKQKEEAFFWSMMFLVVGAITFMAMFFQAYMFGISGERLTLRLREMCFRAFMKQEVAFFDQEENNTGALCTRLSTDASAIQGATGARIGAICMNIAAIGTGLVIGFVYSWKLTLLLIAFVPIIMFAFGLQMKILQGTAASGREALEDAGKTVTEVITNMRTVASLTKEIHFYNEFERQTGVPNQKAVFKSNIIGVTFGISQSVIFFAYAAIFYLGAYLVEEENLHFEDMFKVYGAIIFSAMAMGEAGHFAPDYGKAKAAGSRVFALLDREPAIDSSSTDGKKPAQMKGVINFKDVQFVYPTRPTVQVLHGLSLNVLPGQSIALVGPSGCGKSTTVSLLERFYDSETGQVNIDGVDVKSLNIQWLRSQMAIVQQEPILFDTSIRENIAYGCLHDPSMDEIINAARNANIHTFVSSLPDGYETNVGDKGTQMSGGQKQRIAIARALIRNPKILLLDEATSALDTESEQVVQEALDRAQEGRTSIVIAHRLSTIRDSDCIFVIRNGTVHEKGTHNDLMASKGIYYKLNQAQSKKSTNDV